MSFGEFERRYQEVVERGEERDRKTLAVAANALTGFRLTVRPVFWRMLIVQARLYQELLRTRSKDFRIPATQEDWERLLRLDDAHDFARGESKDDARGLDETLGVADQYFSEFVVRPRAL